MVDPLISVILTSQGIHGRIPRVLNGFFEKPLKSHWKDRVLDS